MAEYLLNGTLLIIIPDPDQVPGKGLGKLKKEIIGILPCDVDLVPGLNDISSVS